LIVKNVSKISVIHGTDDLYTTILLAGYVAKRFGANFIKIEKGGHLTMEKFPSLVKVIVNG